MNDKNSSRKTKVAIIGIVGVPACYGGFESLVDNLLDFTPPDVEYTVFCSASKYEKRLETYKGARLVYLDRDANGVSSVLYDYEGMKRAVALGADVMLVLGVSGCLFLPRIRRRFKGKIITNIDGLEWKRDKWKFYAKWLLRFSERQAVRHSDIIIGDNRGITDYIKSAYKKVTAKKRVELIAYGGDNVVRGEDDSLFAEYPYARENYAVTVCRIEPENNVHVILEAFASLEKSMENGSLVVVGNWGNSKYGKGLREMYTLVVVGNWEKSEYGRALKEKYSRYKNLHLFDPIYEGHTINWIRSHASLYVHGHSAGGTNPSLVEAMNLGLPILAFDCVYNRATTEEKALYWRSAEDIRRLVLERQGEFKRVADDMLEVGKRLYSWEKIAGLYNALWKN